MKSSHNFKLDFVCRHNVHDIQCFDFKDLLNFFMLTTIDSGSCFKRLNGRKDSCVLTVLSYFAPNVSNVHKN